MLNLESYEMLVSPITSDEGEQVESENVISAKPPAKSFL